MELIFNNYKKLFQELEYNFHAFKDNIRQKLLIFIKKKLK